MGARLEDMNIVVTGGGSGIGRGIALRCAGEGARVAVLGRREDALAETVSLGPKGALTAFVVDVTDAAAVDACVAQIAESFGGRIDALVNNAGLGGTERLL
jgi:NAD(P)-dependent dehydrogenase (short-subunit alcohol dehydrogenase family)